jgi:ATP-dependent Clp protease ATP-binding subunit ClpA
MSKMLEELNISSMFFPYLDNLSEKADNPDRMPFIGREKEIEAVLETLMRRLKHNLLLVGKSGVGKTALITEVASRINQKKVPPPLHNKIILEFSLNQFYYSRDSIEALLKELQDLFSQLMVHKEKIILFLDEMQLQSLPSSDKKNRKEQVLNVLRTHVAQRELNIIAAATPENYYQSVKMDEVMALNFCPITLEEPGKEEMQRILKGVAPFFENYYSIKIPPTLFERIVFLLDHFKPHLAFPHKAIDLMDMCCSRASLKGLNQLDMGIIHHSISDECRLPISIVESDPSERRIHIGDFLKKEVINQKDAIDEISRIIKLSGLETVPNKSRPEGVFLFLGPAGVGKSFVSRKIAEHLFGSSKKLRVIDLQDYQEPDQFKKLISDKKQDTGILIDEIDRHPFSVILFENIGDADDTILNDLMKTITQGKIIDATGNKHYTSNIIFILSLTSIGEERFESQIGFIKGEQYRYSIYIPPKIDNVLDWVDEIIEFTPLTEEHLKLIADHKMDDISDEIKKRYNSDIKVNENVFTSISQASLQEGGFAHTVSEKIERQIKMKLLDLIDKDQQAQSFEVSMKNDAIVIKHSD